MIQLSSNVILVLHDDATTEPLDTEEIQTRIIRACIAAGETDSWIAGDLALAVEYSLLSSEQRMIRARELDHLILSTLEDAGYPAVAAEFRRIARSAPPDFLPANGDSVRLVLKNHLVMEPERSERVVSKTEHALELLGMEQVSRGLILELARQFRDSDVSAGSPPVPEVRPPSNGNGAIILRKDIFMERAGGTTGSFLRSKVLRVFHVSRLFSVLRVELSLSGFSELLGLEKPVTELAFWSVSSGLAGSIGELCRIADSACLELGEHCTPLPLSLSVRDAVPFAQMYMNCPKESAVECIRGLMGAFISSLERQPFKVQLQ